MTKLTPMAKAIQYEKQGKFLLAAQEYESAGNCAGGHTHARNMYTKAAACRTKWQEHIGNAFMDVLMASGHKVLIRSYCTALGEVEFISKKDDHLWFIGVDKSLDNLERIAKYYVGRYGLQHVKYKVLSI